jgi:hypothetical protein
LKLPEFGAVDTDGVAKMPEPAQESIHPLRVAQKIGPFDIDQIRRNNGRPIAIPFLDKLEKDIRLLLSRFPISNRLFF